MAIIKCPECGHQVSDKAATCPSCGVGIAGNITTCPECGEIVFKDLTLCPNCHCPLIQDSSTTVSGNSRNGTEKDDVIQRQKHHSLQAREKVKSLILPGAFRS